MYVSNAVTEIHFTDEDYQMIPMMELSLFFRVTLSDLYNGKTSKLQINKTVICAKCHG